MGNKDARRLPVVSLSAEYLAIGQLMRRNILTYKAPPDNEGYDLICIHPDPSRVTKQVRVQVKNRYQTDCDGAFPIKAKTFAAFDYVVLVFLNIGYFYGGPWGPPMGEEKRDPEFYTLPRAFVKKHHYKPKSGFEKVRTKGLDLTKYEGDIGFEQIAKDLGIPDPRQTHGQ